MGTYNGFKMLLGGGNKPASNARDTTIEFEVQSGKIVTYKIEHERKLFKGWIENKTIAGEISIDPEAKILQTLDQRDGSGTCTVSAGTRVINFQIYESVNEFAAEVQQQIDLAQS